jgi:hypothetical protein
MSPYARKTEHFEFEVTGFDPMVARGQVLGHPFYFGARSTQWRLEIQAVDPGEPATFTVETHQFFAEDPSFVEPSLVQTIFIVERCLALYVALRRDLPKA